MSGCFTIVWFVIFLASPVSFGIESAASVTIKKANVITLTKEIGTPNNDKNMVTKLVAENSSDGEIFPHEIAGEKVWCKNGYFGDVRLDYNMKKQIFLKIRHLL